MAIEWEDTPAKKESTRVSDHITVEPGQSLRIETSPSGAEVLNVTCPMSETWDVHFVYKITATPV